MVDAAPHARVSEKDGILTVVLDRDAQLNAIGEQILGTLWDALRDLRSRDDLRALVITAVGRYFTAGADMAFVAGNAASASDGRAFRAVYRDQHLLFDEFEAVEKPVVLAAQGRCLGQGVEMACSCDFRFAAERASFRLPEVGMGLIAGSGGTSRLTRLVGPHWAKWMAMGAREVDAERALAIGFVHEVFTDVDFHEQVHARVREIVAAPPQALGAAKLAIDLADRTDRATARDIERLVNSTLVFGEEFRALRSRPPGAS